MATNKLLVVMPVRDREEHVKQSVPFLHNTLEAQGIDHTIVLVEQTPGKPFNRGFLCNVGFDIFGDGYTHVCPHDVDMLSESLDYALPAGAATIVGHRSRCGDRPVIKRYFGGVVIIASKLFRRMRGFSNEYWGWGCEDDDLRLRCEAAGGKIETRDGVVTDLECAPAPSHTDAYQKNLTRLKAFMALTPVGKKKRARADGLDTLEYTIAGARRENGYCVRVVVNPGIEFEDKSKADLLVFTSLGSNLSSDYVQKVLSSWQPGKYDIAAVMFSERHVSVEVLDKLKYCMKIPGGLKFPNLVEFLERYPVLDHYRHVAVMDDDLLLEQEGAMDMMMSNIRAGGLSVAGPSRSPKQSLAYFKHSNTPCIQERIAVVNLIEMGAMFIRTPLLKDFISKYTSRYLPKGVKDYGIDMLFSHHCHRGNSRFGICRNVTYNNPPGRDEGRNVYRRQFERLKPGKCVEQKLLGSLTLREADSKDGSPGRVVVCEPESNTVYFVVSMPRTGTTSVCRMAEICGLKAEHVLRWPLTSRIHTEGFKFFADTPFYMPEFLIGVLQYLDDVKFIYLDRDAREWKASFDALNKRMRELWSRGGRTPTQREDLHDRVAYTYFNKERTQAEHKKIIQDIARVYDIPMLSYNFVQGWQPFCKFIGVAVPTCDIPHLNPRGELNV